MHKRFSQPDLNHDGSKYPQQSPALREDAQMIESTKAHLECCRQASRRYFPTQRFPTSSPDWSGIDTASRLH